MKERKLSSTAHPMPFLLVSATDHVTPVYGATPTVGISKDGGPWIAPAGAIAENSIAAPSAPTVSNAASGGAVAAGTYYFVVTFVNAIGETVGSAQSSTTTTGSASTITITAPSSPPATATGWKVYGGTTSGTNYYLQGGVNTLGVNLTLTTTPATSGANPPAANSTSGGWYSLAGNATDRNTLGSFLIHATATAADPSDSFYTIVPWDAFDANLALTGLNGLAAPAAAGGLPTIGTGTGQVSPDGAGNVPIAMGQTVPVNSTAGTTGASLLVVGEYTIRRGTAQGGASATITLDAGASATDGFYADQNIILVSGTGAGQSRTITTYTGATKVAGVTPAWSVAPDSTSKFIIAAENQVDVGIWNGTPIGTAVPKVELDNTALAAVATSLLTSANAIEGAYTLQQAIQWMLAALAGQVSGASGTTIVIKNPAGATTRITATVDSSGDRTAITLS